MRIRAQLKTAAGEEPPQTGRWIRTALLAAVSAVAILGGVGCGAPAEPSDAPPPRDVEPPIDPRSASELRPARIAGRAQAAVARLTAVRAGIDPFLGLDADADIRVVGRLDTLSRTLSGLADRLRKDAGEEPDAGLRTLDPDTRRLGTRLHLATRRLEALLAEQERCGLRGLGVFLAALETLALDLGPESERGPKRSAGPRAHYLFAEGHRPGVVPRGGGWLFVVGAELPHDGDPRAAIVRVGGRSRRSIEAQRVGEGDRAVAVHLGPEWIDGHRGECFRLEIRPAAPSGLFFWRERKRVAVARTPLCVPQAFDTRYQLAGELEYRAARSERDPPQNGGASEGPGAVDAERPARRSWAISGPFDALAPAASTCLAIPREAPSARTAIQFELIVRNGRQRRRLFESPSRLLGEPTSRSYTTDGLRIRAELDPAPRSEASEVCVEIDAPDCRY